MAVAQARLFAIQWNARLKLKEKLLGNANGS